MGSDSIYHCLQDIDRRVPDMETRVAVDVGLIATQMQLMLTQSLTPVASALLVTRLLLSANLPPIAIGTIYLYSGTGFLIQRYLAPDYAGFAAQTSAKEGVTDPHQRSISCCLFALDLSSLSSS